ncbi:MAG: hypothetical protein Q4D79_10605 [Propionibacteriaceae bacterium]|nr:hypothetical protein [Propionibacteriaceae bacterium]
MPAATRIIQELGQHLDPTPEAQRLRVQLTAELRPSDVVAALVGAEVRVEALCPTHETLEATFLDLVGDPTSDSRRGGAEIVLGDETNSRTGVVESRIPATAPSRKERNLS